MGQPRQRLTGPVQQQSVPISLRGEIPGNHIVPRLIHIGQRVVLFQFPDQFPALPIIGDRGVVQRSGDAEMISQKFLIQRQIRRFALPLIQHRSVLRGVVTDKAVIIGHFQPGSVSVAAVLLIVNLPRVRNRLLRDQRTVYVVNAESIVTKQHDRLSVRAQTGLVVNIGGIIGKYARIRVILQSQQAQRRRVAAGRQSVFSGQSDKITASVHLCLFHQARAAVKERETAPALIHLFACYHIVTVTVKSGYILFRIGDLCLCACLRINPQKTVIIGEEYPALIRLHARRTGQIKEYGLPQIDRVNHLKYGISALRARICGESEITIVESALKVEKVRGIQHFQIAALFIFQIEYGQAPVLKAGRKQRTVRV